MTPAESRTRTRVSLSARDLSSEAGVKLLQHLEEVSSDGVVSEAEVIELAHWLNEASSVADAPGIHFLREEFAGVLADGIVSDAEKRLLREAILRVLPTTERERARARFSESAAKVRETRKKEKLAVADLATPAQLEYISGLGGSLPEGATKGDASEMIESLLASRPTVRQRMVLRFWNRLDLSGAGVDGVSAWMDQWYGEDPDRAEAWALWKREARDEGQRTSDNIDRVPLGEGEKYLARLKAERDTNAERKVKGAVGGDAVQETGGRGQPASLALFVYAVVVALVGLFFFLLR